MTESLQVDRRRRALLVLGYLVRTGPERNVAVPGEIVVAHQQEPRPGRWIEGDCYAVLEPEGRITLNIADIRKTRGDANTLTQEQTDALIQMEVHRTIAPIHNVKMYRALESVCIWPDAITDARLLMAVEQRGGLHTDPKVRALALALWGRRDVGIPRDEVEARRR